MTARHARSIRRVLQDTPFPNGLTCLLENLANATPDETAQGLAWYADAHAHAADLAHIYGVRPTTVAGIIAATSPQVSWEQNLGIADALLSGERNVCLGLGERRALAILNGAFPLDVLGGRKVRSFFRNICTPHLDGPVTVDRHAIAVLTGQTTPECNRTHGRFLERTGAYVHAAAHYRTVARAQGLRAHEVQAISWVAHRNRTEETIDHGDF